jgi:hypothetical protein
MNRLLLLPALVLGLASASCADESTVSVKYAPGYKPGPAVVSVLGVFRDGRMSLDTWSAMASPVSTALGAMVDRCEPAYGERLQHENEELFASLDDDTRNNGITEELLAKLAPRAQGDVILFITVHGQVGETYNDKRGSQTRAPSPNLPQRGPTAGRGPRGGNVREAAPRGPTLKPLELSASLYSIKDQKPFVRLNLSYTGQSADEAIRRFTTELGALVPGASCKGWTFPQGKIPSSVAPLLEGP